MNTLAFVVLLLCSVAALPASADPYGWFDRCMVKAEANKKKAVPGPWDVDSFHCVSNALNICEFTLNDRECFDEFHSIFVSRSKALIDSFPASLEGTNASGFRKRGYPRLLKLLLEPADFQCPPNLAPFQCDALTAALQYGEALALKDYISNTYEETEENE